VKKDLHLARILIIVGTLAITALVCVLVFDSSFAQRTVDYFSFAAALFLIIDGFYKIHHYKGDPYFPNQLIRHIRIIIGVSIFSIHVMQFVYGV